MHPPYDIQNISMIFPKLNNGLLVGCTFNHNSYRWMDPISINGMSWHLGERKSCQNILLVEADL